jgi:hypothetical protein
MKTATIQIVDRGIGIEVEMYLRGKKQYGFWAVHCNTILEAIAFARRHLKELGYTHTKRLGFADRSKL